MIEILVIVCAVIVLAPIFPLLGMIGESIAPALKRIADVTTIGCVLIILYVVIFT